MDFIAQGEVILSLSALHLTRPTVLPSLHTRLSQRSKSVGAPTLLFLTGAALRAADVARIFKDKKVRGEKGGEVAKLFAKHFKLGEHVAYLKKTKVCVAVGTPSRVGKLLCETGKSHTPQSCAEILIAARVMTDAFSLSALTHIMLDVSFRDAKQRSLLDIPETRDEVFRTVLGCSKVINAVRAGQVQVVLF
jgi:protein CMS1